METKKKNTSHRADRVVSAYNKKELGYEGTNEKRDYSKRPLSSVKIQARPQTSNPNIKNLLMSHSLTNRSKFLTNPTDENNAKGELDVLYLIMKTSPVKYDMNLVTEKLKKLNKFYDNKKLGHSISKTEETYFRYNILYGTKSNEILRAYSPKMRPQSASVSNFNKDNFTNVLRCFTSEEITRIYQAKCADLDIKTKENIEKKFQEYCGRKCINREADFTECNFKFNCAKVLSEIISNNENISHLILSKNGLCDSGVEILIKSLQNSLSIIHLDLSSNDITHKGGDDIFECLKKQQSIISLNLSSIDGINRNRLTAEGVKKLEEVLKINHYLQYLNLGSNSLKNEGLKYIIKGLDNNTSLIQLCLSHNEINHQGISYFNNILTNSKLFELDLSQNPIGNEGIDTISECISKNSLHSLRKLNLSECKITFSGFYDFIINLQSNKKLESLLLNGNNLSSDKFAKVKTVFNVLNLKELKLSKCKIDNEGACSIAEGFINNTSLKNLDISENRIDDRGFSHFSQFSTINYTLEKFDVSKNLITDASCKDFIKGLKKNTQLKVLNFFDNQLKNETGTALVDILRHNKNLTKINLKFNRIPTRLQEEIDRLIKKNSENYKQIFVPNLKKEIRQIYVTDNDFEHCDHKIHETGANLKNIVEKLKEDSSKYSALKIEEADKVENIQEINIKLNKELHEIENKLFEAQSDIDLSKNEFKQELEILQKELYLYTESIKILEGKQKDLKQDQESTKMNFEVEITNLNSILKNSEKNLHYALESSEMLAKELENKKAILEKLENPEINRNSISNSPDKNFNRKISFAKGRVSMLGLNKDSKKDVRKISLLSKMVENVISNQTIEENVNKKEDINPVKPNDNKKNLKGSKTEKSVLMLNETKTSRVERSLTNKDPSIKKDSNSQKGKKFERTKPNV